jgi:hypothetical protein
LFAAAQRGRAPDDCARDLEALVGMIRAPADDPPRFERRRLGGRIFAGMCECQRILAVLLRALDLVVEEAGLRQSCEEPRAQAGGLRCITQVRQGSGIDRASGSERGRPVTT